MLLYLMLHTMTHLAHSWRMSAGPDGWWAYFQSRTAPEALGFGFAHGHYISAYEMR